MFLWEKGIGEEKRIEKIQRENGISENFEKGAFLVKRGERLFFCRGKEDDGSAKGVLHWERTRGFSGFGFWRRGIFGAASVV